MLFILFGLAACGKNYVGQTLAKHENFYFYDGDELLSEDMRTSIREKKPFTQIMRDDFTKRMIEKISELQKQHPHLVFAQALYKEKNREQILAAFPNAKFILINSSEENRAARLQKRDDWIDEAYAEKMRVHFDPPHLTHTSIENNQGADEIIKQLNPLLP